jgi:predicted MFS family arabinose efflux permease
VLSAAAIALWTRNTPPHVRWHAAEASSGRLSDVFRDIRFWRIAPLNFWLLGGTSAVQGLWAGPFLFDVLRLPNIAVGNLLLAMSAGVVVGYFVCGLLGELWGMARTVIGAALLSLLCQLVFILPGIWPLALFYAAFFGFGAACTVNLLLLAQIRAVFPLSMSGRAATAVNMFGFGGAALIQWWMGLIIGAFAPDAQGHYPALAYTLAFLFMAIGVGLALVWYLPLTQRHSEAAAPATVPAER